MKKNIVIVNIIICALLVAELAFLASGYGIVASIIAGVAAAAAIALFVVNRDGESAIAMIACSGYAIAIISGLVVESMYPGQAMGIGLLLGGATMVVQVAMTITRNEGRM